MAYPQRLSTETGVPTLIKIALEPTTFRTFTTTKPTGTSNSLSITSTPAPISHTSTKTSLSTSTTATSPFNFFTSTSNSNSNSTSATSNNSTASHPAIIFHILGILIVVAMIGFLYLKCCWCRGRKKSKLAEAKARLDERNKMAQQQAEIANGRPGFAAAGNGNGYMMQQGYGYGYAPQPQMQQENANVTAPANAYPVRGAKRPMESEGKEGKVKPVWDSQPLQREKREREREKASNKLRSSQNNDGRERKSPAKYGMRSGCWTSLDGNEDTQDLN
ncbi:hypothetical protein ACMFMG_008567 [Clarireedia jacksonii]